VLTHPLVVHFPIALWLTATFFDVLAWRRPDPVFRQSAYWLVGLGLLGAAVSILLGWIDLLAAEREGVGTGVLIRHRTHSIVAYCAAAAYAGNFVWRWRIRNRFGTGQLILSLAGAVLIALTAFLGGEVRQVM
jgi:uncharacterized membrane protein